LDGRKTEQHLLNRSENTVSSAASQINARQTQQQTYQQGQMYNQPYSNVPNQAPYNRQ
jgi:hypothetical protein